MSVDLQVVSWYFSMWLWICWRTFSLTGMQVSDLAVGSFMLVEQHSKGWQSITPTLILDNGHILEFSLKSSFCLWVCHWGLSLLSHAEFWALLKVSPIHGTIHTCIKSLFSFIPCSFVVLSLAPYFNQTREQNPPLTHLHQINSHSSIGFHFISIFFMTVHPIYFHNIHLSIFIFIWKLIFDQIMPIHPSNFMDHSFDLVGFLSSKSSITTPNRETKNPRFFNIYIALKLQINNIPKAKVASFKLETAPNKKI